MAVANDVMNTIRLINNFWPDLHFDKEDFVQGKPDFIVRFYTTFVAELNDKLSFLINEENIFDEFDHIQDFDKEVTLYCKVAKVFRKMKYTSLNLADFYIKNPKKNYPFLKFSIHFMIFVNNFLDEICSIVNENFKKLLESDNLKILKEQYLHDSASNAENIARLDDIYEQLQTEFEELKKLTEKMMEDKVVDDKNCLELTTELNDLQKETDNLEYELKLLDDKEKDLLERVITDCDFESLKNTEKLLETEYQKLCNDSTDCDIDVQMEALTRYENYAKQLSKLRFDSLDVETLHELRQQALLSRQNNKKSKEELSRLDSIVTNESKNTEELKQSLSKIQLFCDEFKAKFAMDERNEQNFYKKKVMENAANFEKCQKLETESLSKQEEIRKIEDGEHTLNATVAEEYQRILQMDKKTTNKFYNMLLYLANHQ